MRTIMVLLPGQGLRAFWGKRGDRFFLPRGHPGKRFGRLLKSAQPSFRDRPRAAARNPYSERRRERLTCLHHCRFGTLLAERLSLTAVAAPRRTRPLALAQLRCLPTAGDQ